MDDSSQDHAPERLVQSLKKKTLFVVVSFSRRVSRNEKSMSTVPRKWAHYYPEEDDWKVFYPPPKEYDILDEYVKGQRDPKSSWKLYRCKMIKEAVDYEQAERRLSRALENISSDIESSQIEDGELLDEESHHLYPSVKVNVLNNEELDKELDSVDLTSSEDEEAYGSSSKRKRTSQGQNGRLRQRLNLDDSLDKIEVAPASNQGKLQRQSSPAAPLNRQDSLARPMLGAKPGDEIHDEQHRILFNAISKELAKEFKKMKRSLMYDLNKKITQLNNNLNSSTQRFGISVTEAMETLAITLPFNAVAEVNAFDEVLKNDPEKKKILKTLMATRCTGSTNFKDSLSVTLSGLLSKPLQLEYPACGKKVRGHKKLSFTDTVIYNCLEAVLVEKHTVSPNFIISKMSRWFTGASDRAGNRKRQATEPQEQ